jgi:putative FmdB family regulatory protein
MPIYEYRCVDCGNVDEKLEFGSEVNKEHFCSSCGKPSDRIVSKCRFELVYNNKTDMCDWQGNTSMYWNDYKKSKENGEKVKPAGED